MTDISILLPVFAQVALTFALGIWLAAARYGAVRAGTSRVRDIALGQPAWPARVIQIANCFANQFEMPVLFYVLAVLVVLTGTSDGVMIGLAWGFVTLRVVHAAIHTTRNDVRYRFYVFLAGSGLLAIMWLILGVRTLASGGP
ncbi:MAG: MAPEG family protein [Hyphomicrobiaceae bacterium]